MICLQRLERWQSVTRVTEPSPDNTTVMCIQNSIFTNAIPTMLGTSRGIMEVITPPKISPGRQCLSVGRMSRSITVLNNIVIVLYRGLSTFLAIESHFIKHFNIGRSSSPPDGPSYSQTLQFLYFDGLLCKVVQSWPILGFAVDLGCCRDRDIACCWHWVQTATNNTGCYRIVQLRRTLRNDSVCHRMYISIGMWISQSTDSWYL